MKIASRLCLVGILAASVATSAGTPSSGTLSLAQRELVYTYGPNLVSNPSPQAEPGGLCNEPAQPCDHFELTVDLPADFASTNPNAEIRIETAWDEPADDYDVYLMTPGGDIVRDAASSNNPEVIQVPAGGGLQNFRIRIIPFAVSASTATTTITLIVPPPPPVDTDGDGVSDGADLCPGTPPSTSVDGTGCPITLPPGPECTLPGLQLFTDADEDFTDPNDNQAFDIRSLQVAEQNFSTGKKLYFTLKVDSLATLPTTSARWIITFKGANGLFYFLTMTKFADQGAPIFEYGTLAAEGTPATTTPGCFDGIGPLDPGSKFDVDGTITMIVDAATVGSPAGGQSLGNVVARAQALNGSSLVCGASTNYDTAPQAATAYTLSTTCPIINVPPPGLPSGLPPRFYDFQSPPGLGDGAGEPTIGYNPATKNTMFIAGLEVDRVTYAENSELRDAAGDPLPEACDPVWQDKSYAGAANTLDPILETEITTGRTFQSQLAGANSIFAFSDDEGDTWIPAQVGPPNGGADHQTVGVGPWAPGAKPPTATVDYAVYYCSQSVAAAFCSRSDNGGVTFGPGIDFRDTLTDCNNTIGGLHGHTQVARNDGTVYVPFGNCGSNVGMAVSTDSGLTWTVKTIPQAAGGDDPGLGIADDGTAYMCYAEGNGGKVFASVSSDRGDTWSEHYELTAAVGVKHAVFVTAVAGDGDRAACAFLGTTTAGNPEAENFPGIWYPYVSTTYDGGKTWHTVNVAPNDPVQGAGGICLSGTLCGGNRNLLDFNDILIDETGRVMFGYSDGCIGACVQSPANNSFTDNGVLARQSGGRTLRKAFDNVGQFNATAAVKPARACARKDLSLRTDLQARVAWTPPDNGGSPILNYEVYRSETPVGGFVFVGNSGPKTSFIDATADPGVPTYYYKVVAENAQGAADASNVIDLGVTIPETFDSCVTPGVTVANESAPGDCTGTGGGCTPPVDIQRISVAEPRDTPDQFVFTLKVASLAPEPPAGAYWYILTSNNRYLAMDTSLATPRFTYGTYTVGTLTTFDEEGTLDASSGYDANGNIFLVVDRALLGSPEPGDVISPVEARTRQGDASLPSRDVVSGGGYSVRGTNVCLPNTPPIARLTGTPQSGPAPLTVVFDGSTSSDPDVNVPDTVQTYVITFGDGTSASATSPEAPVWTHVYPNNGPFKAELRVFDSRGLRSDNVAEKVIEVGSVVPGTPGADGTPGQGNNRIGGSLPALTLLGLGLGALLRRRRPGSGLPTPAGSGSPGKARVW